MHFGLGIELMCSLMTSQLIHLILQPLVYMASELGGLLTHLTWSPIVSGAEVILNNFWIIVAMLIVLVRLRFRAIIWISCGVEILCSTWIDL